MYTYKRVALIGVDGAGNFFTKANTPNIDKIFEGGSIAYDVYTSIPSISAECWGSMLHGVTPELHRLTNGLVSSVPYDTDSPFPSVFRVIRENDPDCELASFCNWNPINYGIIENNLGVTENTSGDAELTDKICAYLEDHDPKLLFVQFDEVDGAGHHYGYGTEQHLAQIGITDRYIRRIYDMYEKRGFIDDTLFIVTADHGGFGHGHGGKTEEEMRVMFALKGKTVEKGGAAVDMQIRDSASVVLHALGYKQPENWTSIVPSGIFEGVSASERHVYTIEYNNAQRTRESTSTPAYGSGNCAADVIGDGVRAYFTFDEDNTDCIGKIKTESSGKFYYLDGYFGKGVRFDDGYITTEGFNPGKNSFSVAFWMKTGGIPGDPAILSNKNWGSGSNKGFILGASGTAMFFNYGNGSARMDTGYPLPIDFKDGWVYIIFTVDREAGKVGFSVDFAPVKPVPIRDIFMDDSFDTDMPVRIGQDGTGNYGSHLSAIIDEMLIVDRALTDDDIAALKKIYGAE